MRVRVNSCICLRRAEAPAKLIERLRRALSFPNPAYLDRLRLGLPVGGEPRMLCFLDEDEEEVCIPRGGIHVLRQLAGLDGVDIKCDDRRVFPSERLLDLPLPQLRDYQARAVTKLIQVTQGSAIVPCGGGKTRIGVGAVAVLRTPALILVHTLDIAEQWREEFQDLLHLEVGFLGGGEDSTCLVTIALVQTLSQWSDPQLDDFLGRFGLLVLDEHHHVAASTFRRIVGRCPSRYRLGLTATPEREDGLTPLLELYFGKPLVVVSHEELVAAGVLTLPEIRSVETGFSYPYNGMEDYAPMLDALVADEARNSLVVENVAREAGDGNICLVLSGRVEHCEALNGQLLARGIASAALTGKVPKERRKVLLDGARAGRIKVLVATSLADEGLDLPRLSRVFLAYPGRAKGRTMQRLGRLMRPHQCKTSAMLFDFVDRKIPVLRRQHTERRHLYTEILGVSRTGV